MSAAEQTDARLHFPQSRRQVTTTTNALSRQDNRRGNYDGRASRGRPEPPRLARLALAGQGCDRSGDKRRRRRRMPLADQGQAITRPGVRGRRDAAIKAGLEAEHIQHTHHQSQPSNMHNQHDQNSDQLASNQSHSGACRALLTLGTICLLAASLVPACEAVDCFKCSSRNGSNPLCEDPFHNLNTTRINSPILPDPQPSVIYHTPCYAGKKGRDGLFPASACIKLTGVFDTTGETLVVRHCALDSGTLTQDTELARMSHCGKFQFEGDLLRGCVLACPEDACNAAHSSQAVHPAWQHQFLAVLSASVIALLTLGTAATANTQT